LGLPSTGREFQLIKGKPFIDILILLPIPIEYVPINLTVFIDDFFLGKRVDVYNKK